jgi:hypothetical protein
MKTKLLSSVMAGLLISAAGVMTAHAQNTYITFSVDESSNLVSGTFNPPAPAIVGGVSYGGSGTDIVAVRGTFDGWAYPGLQLNQVGSTPVYTNTVDDTNAQDHSDGNVNFIYDDTVNGGEAPGDYQNRMAYLPPGNNASLVLPTAFFNDNGPAATANVKFQVDMSEEIELGHFHPLTGDTVVVAGSFNGWSPTAGSQWVLTNDPSILITNNNFTPPIVESNVYTLTAAVTANARVPLAAPNCAEEFKFVEMPEYGWDSPNYPNKDPDSGNRFFAELDQTLPLVMFNDAVYSPVANVTLNLDMSTIVKYDPDFEPGTVQAWGSFNGWAGPVVMTNNPAAPNTNLYTATITAGEGSPYVLQYRYTNSLINSWVYDYAVDGGPDWNNNNNYRRIINLPVTTSVLTTNFLVVYFDDLAPDDVLSAATPVTFSVDMNGAVGSDGHVFSPVSDNVYVNGSFFGGTTSPGFPSPSYYAWSGGSPPVSAPYGTAYEMVEQGSSTIYTNTILVPAGTPVALDYAYGIDPGAILGGPVENEASAATPHFRVIRSLGTRPYVMPTDTFSTNQPYQEPLFDNVVLEVAGNTAGGDLSVGKAVAGTVPVTWLGRPGAQLQTAASLAGPWSNHPETDGTNWTSGSSSVNGLVSQTNWPSTGRTFFRLVKP